MRLEEAIGKKIKEAREERGWTQSTLGVGVLAVLGEAWSAQTVSAAEKGRRDFRAEDLFALAAILGRPVAWFYEVPVGTEIDLPGSVITVGNDEDPNFMTILPNTASQAMVAIRTWFGDAFKEAPEAGEPK
jgi:transcriptional regulator with XRE-family HTH domain